MEQAGLDSITIPMDPEEATVALEKITGAVGEGNLTPGEGQTLSAMIENYRRTVESVELEKRLTDLEKRTDQS